MCICVFILSACVNSKVLNVGVSNRVYFMDKILFCILLLVWSVKIYFVVSAYYTVNILYSFGEKTNYFDSLFLKFDYL